jgi:hypothetical protein
MATVLTHLHEFSQFCLAVDGNLFVTGGHRFCPNSESTPRSVYEGPFRRKAHIFLVSKVLFISSVRTTPNA